MTIKIIKVKCIAVLLLSGYFLQAQHNDKKEIPCGRSQHAVGFDNNTATLLIFGGARHPKNINAPSPDNRLWTWKNNNWKPLSAGGPAVREDAKMVYHEKNKKTYLYGGRSYDKAGNPVVHADFWEWNGRRWKLISANASPGSLLHTNLVYDARRNRIVMFAGIDIQKGFTNTVWEWDEYQWKQVAIKSSPSARIGHSMVYSTVLQKILVLGGVNEEDKKLSDIWSWDGNQFELLDNNMPPLETGSYNAACIDDGGILNLLLVGRPVNLAGSKEIQPAKNYADTWLWNGIAWKKLDLEPAPSLREGQSLICDKKNKQVFLFGGNGREESAFGNPNDLWVFKNYKWKCVSTAVSR